GVALPAGAWTLGRGDAAARRGNFRHGGAVRFFRAGYSGDFYWPHPARHGGAVAWSAVDCGGCQGPAYGVSGGGDRGGGAFASSSASTSRTAGFRTREAVEHETVLGAVSARAGDGGAVPAWRSLSERRARGEAGAGGR